MFGSLGFASGRVPAWSIGFGLMNGRRHEPSSVFDAATGEFGGDNLYLIPGIKT